jgi:hypothetical protein
LRERLPQCCPLRPVRHDHPQALLGGRTCCPTARYDGIDYHSRRTDVLPDRTLDDTFVPAVLRPEYPLVQDQATFFRFVGCFLGGSVCWRCCCCEQA